MTHLLRPRLLAVAAALAVLALAVRAGAWGTVGHQIVAQNYSKQLPADMAAFAQYDSLINAHVMDPDSRKGAQYPAESYRHFLDIDWYPAFFTNSLTHDRNALAAQYTDYTVLHNGTQPWAEDTTMTALRDSMRAGYWNGAALLVADLAHYVGDAHQPLHCTKNYDGQYTGNNGVHSRYETTMLNTYGSTIVIPLAGGAVLIPNTVDSVFSFITRGWARVDTVLHADTQAKLASGGQFNATYYASLWTQLQGITVDQFTRACVSLASLVYTAWDNAGRPHIPGSATSIGDGEPPSASRTLHAAANSASGVTTFSCRAATAGALRLRIVDTAGRATRELHATAAQAGDSLSLVWDGRDTAGRQVVSGVYWARTDGAGPALRCRVVHLRR